jgi:hypothetical protein
MKINIKKILTFIILFSSLISNSLFLYASSESKKSIILPRVLGYGTFASLDVALWQWAKTKELGVTSEDGVEVTAKDIAKKLLNPKQFLKIVKKYPRTSSAILLFEALCAAGVIDATVGVTKFVKYIKSDERLEKQILQAQKRMERLESTVDEVVVEAQRKLDEKFDQELINRQEHTKHKLERGRENIEEAKERLTSVLDESWEEQRLREDRERLAEKRSDAAGKYSSYITPENSFWWEHYSPQVLDEEEEELNEREGHIKESRAQEIREARARCEEDTKSAEERIAKYERKLTAIAKKVDSEKEFEREVLKAKKKLDFGELVNVKKEYVLLQLKQADRKRAKTKDAKEIPAACLECLDRHLEVIDNKEMKLSERADNLLEIEAKRDAYIASLDTDAEDYESQRDSVNFKIQKCIEGLIESPEEEGIATKIFNISDDGLSVLSETLEDMAPLPGTVSYPSRIFTIKERLQSCGDFPQLESLCGSQLHFIEMVMALQEARGLEKIAVLRELSSGVNPIGLIRELSSLVTNEESIRRLKGEEEISEAVDDVRPIYQRIIKDNQKITSRLRQLKLAREDDDDTDVSESDEDEVNLNPGAFIERLFEQIKGINFSGLSGLAQPPQPAEPEPEPQVPTEDDLD